MTAVLFKIVLACTLLCMAAALDPKVEWFNQNIDHFTFLSSGQTFKQQLLYADSFYRKGGPLIFYTGNEGDVMSYWTADGFLFELANELGAFLVFAEHRYYGNSLPFGAASFDANNLVFLSSEQAMADYAILIPWLKNRFGLGEATKVIAAGGSYGGMLSAYMRLKYPYLVDAALAASAPIAIFPGMADPFAFFATVTTDFAQAQDGATCAQTIRAAQLEVAAATQTPAGRAHLASVFPVCSPLDTVAQAEAFAYYIGNGLVTLAQMDYPYAADGLPGNPVNASCAALGSVLHAGGSVLDALAAVVSLAYNYTGDMSCYNVSDNPRCADPTGCGSSIAWVRAARVRVIAVTHTS
jgi:pimeloyl-ACP methyl ester carboxylesterase